MPRRAQVSGSSVEQAEWTRRIQDVPSPHSPTTRDKKGQGEAPTVQGEADAISVLTLPGAEDLRKKTEKGTFLCQPPTCPMTSCSIVCDGFVHQLSDLLDCNLHKVGVVSLLFMAVSPILSTVADNQKALSKSGNSFLQ